MTGRFKIRRCVLCFFVLLGLQFHHLPGARSELLDDLCRAEVHSPRVMQSLIEEAEATGMPPSTLNRLLIKGYHDKDSIRILSRLLCVIVQAEEDGLPPELLFRKLDEGLGKRAPLMRIVEVVEAKVADMHYVQALLSGGEEPRLEDDNVVRLTHALSSGLSKKDLNDLFSLVYDVPVEMRVVAAEIKGYGRAAGFDASLLDQIIASGLASRSLSDEWSFLIKVISEARKQNISDQRITAQAVKVLSRKGSLGDLNAALGIK